MKIEVSVGEVVDKITILEIKSQRIKDEEKLISINTELTYLKKKMKRDKIVVPSHLYEELKKINEEIWELEDILREKEKNKCYDEEFIRNAEGDSVLNDKRFLVKKKINELFDSKIKEQKSYQGM